MMPCSLSEIIKSLTFTKERSIPENYTPMKGYIQSFSILRIQITFSKYNMQLYLEKKY